MVSPRHGGRRPADLLWRDTAIGLAWLKRSGYLDTTSPPGDRITPCRLESYLSYLRSHLATATVENRLVSLDRDIYAMAPAADRTLLRRLIRHVHDPNAGVAQKRRRVVDSYDLFGLGIRMMVEAGGSQA